MANVDNVCTEIPEGFNVTEVYDKLLSDDISDNKLSILNVSRRLSIIELPTIDVPTTPIMGDVTLATMEHLPSTDKSLIFDSASETSGNESLPDVSCLLVSNSTSSTLFDFRIIQIVVS